MSPFGEKHSQESEPEPEMSPADIEAGLIAGFDTAERSPEKMSLSEIEWEIKDIEIKLGLSHLIIPNYESSDAFEEILHEIETDERHMSPRLIDRLIKRLRLLLKRKFESRH